MSDTTTFSKLKGTNKWQCYKCEYTDESDVQSDSWCPRLPFNFDHCPKCGRRISKFVYNSGHSVEPTAKNMLPDGVEWPTINDKPILPHDKVWDYCGKSYTVVSVNFVHEGYSIEMDDGSEWATTYNFYDKPPYHTGQDGVKINIGDTVYFEDTELIVLELRLKEIKCCFANDKDIVFYANPKKLVHKAPDSWEKLEEDAKKDVCDYFGPSECDECPAGFGREEQCEAVKCLDILKRAKVVAEKEKSCSGD